MEYLPVPDSRLLLVEKPKLNRRRSMPDLKEFKCVSSAVVYETISILSNLEDTNNLIIVPTSLSLSSSERINATSQLCREDSPEKEKWSHQLARVLQNDTEKVFNSSPLLDKLGPSKFTNGKNAHELEKETYRKEWISKHSSVRSMRCQIFKCSTTDASVQTDEQQLTLGHGLDRSSSTQVNDNDSNYYDSLEEDEVSDDKHLSNKVFFVSVDSENEYEDNPRVKLPPRLSERLSNFQRQKERKIRNNQKFSRQLITEFSVPFPKTLDNEILNDFQPDNKSNELPPVPLTRSRTGSAKSLESPSFSRKNSLPAITSASPSRSTSATRKFSDQSLTSVGEVSTLGVMYPSGNDEETESLISKDASVANKSSSSSSEITRLSSLDGGGVSSENIRNDKTHRESSSMKLQESNFLHMYNECGESESDSEDEILVIEREGDASTAFHSYNHQASQDLINSCKQLVEDSKNANKATGNLQSPIILRNDKSESARKTWNESTSGNFNFVKLMTDDDVSIQDFGSPPKSLSSREDGYEMETDDGSVCTESSGRITVIAAGRSSRNSRSFDMDSPVDDIARETTSELSEGTCVPLTNKTTPLESIFSGEKRDGLDLETTNGKATVNEMIKMTPKKVDMSTDKQCIHADGETDLVLASLQTDKSNLRSSDHPGDTFYENGSCASAYFTPNEFSSSKEDDRGHKILPLNNTCNSLEDKRENASQVENVTEKESFLKTIEKNEATNRTVNGVNEVYHSDDNFFPDHLLNDSLLGLDDSVTSTDDSVSSLLSTIEEEAEPSGSARSSNAQSDGSRTLENTTMESEEKFDAEEKNSEPEGQVMGIKNEKLYSDETSKRVNCAETCENEIEDNLLSSAILTDDPEGDPEENAYHDSDAVSIQSAVDDDLNDFAESNNDFSAKIETNVNSLLSTYGSEDILAKVDTAVNDTVGDIKVNISEPKDAYSYDGENSTVKAENYSVKGTEALSSRTTVADGYSKVEIIAANATVKGKSDLFVETHVEAVVINGDQEVVSDTPDASSQEACDTEAEEKVDESVRAETGVENEMDFAVESEPEEHLEADADTAIEVKVDSEVGAETDAELEAEADTEMKAEDNAVVAAEDNAVVAAEDNAVVAAEDNAVVAAETNAVVAAETNAVVEAEAEAKVEATADSEVEIRTNAKLEVRANAEFEIRSNVDLEAENDAENEPEAADDVETKDVDEVEAEADDEVEAEAVHEVDAEAANEVEAKAVDEVKAEAVDEVEAKAVYEEEAESVDEVGAYAADEVEAEAADEVEEAEAADEVEAEAADEVEAEADDEMEARALNEVKTEAVDEIEDGGNAHGVESSQLTSNLEVDSTAFGFEKKFIFGTNYEVDQRLVCTLRGDLSASSDRTRNNSPKDGNEIGNDENETLPHSNNSSSDLEKNSFKREEDEGSKPWFYSEVFKTPQFSDSIDNCESVTEDVSQKYVPCIKVESKTCGNENLTDAGHSTKSIPASSLHVALPTRVSVSKGHSQERVFAAEVSPLSLRSSGPESPHSPEPGCEESSQDGDSSTGSPGAAKIPTSSPSTDSGVMEMPAPTDIKQYTGSASASEDQKVEMNPSSISSELSDAVLSVKSRATTPDTNKLPSRPQSAKSKKENLDRIRSGHRSTYLWVQSTLPKDIMEAVSDDDIENIDYKNDQNINSDHHVDEDHDEMRRLWEPCQPVLPASFEELPSPTESFLSSSSPLETSNNQPGSHNSQDGDENYREQSASDKSLPEEYEKHSEPSEVSMRLIKALERRRIRRQRSRGFSIDTPEHQHKPATLSSLDRLLASLPMYHAHTKHGCSSNPRTPKPQVFMSHGSEDDAGTNQVTVQVIAGRQPPDVRVMASRQLRLLVQVGNGDESKSCNSELSESSTVREIRENNYISHKHEAEHYILRKQAAEEKRRSRPFASGSVPREAFRETNTAVVNLKASSNRQHPKLSSESRKYGRRPRQAAESASNELLDDHRTRMANQKIRSYSLSRTMDSSSKSYKLLPPEQVETIPSRLFIKRSLNDLQLGARRHNITSKISTACENVVDEDGTKSKERKKSVREQFIERATSILGGSERAVSALSGSGRAVSAVSTRCSSRGTSARSYSSGVSLGDFPSQVVGETSVMPQRTTDMIADLQHFYGRKNSKKSSELARPHDAPASEAAEVFVVRGSNVQKCFPSPSPREVRLRLKPRAKSKDSAVISLDDSALKRREQERLQRNMSAINDLLKSLN
ncbi:uncharacterized protein LOC108683337 [Hyalella azteca]|uniref:Uncharacterized protein LOC108683337 n=1 Tax=Hyalella azteca TaxID=294128 RepID=A0A979FEX3_HYAAZ|nr:uncharacterized protein LOC108683337 [Hyalella azteca]